MHTYKRTQTHATDHTMIQIHINLYIHAQFNMHTELAYLDSILQKEFKSMGMKRVQSIILLLF